MTINISAPAESPATPISSQPFTTDIAGLRAEIKAALLAGAQGEPYDSSRPRPYKVTKPDGTTVEYM
jgi:hypothetical protein